MFTPIKPISASDIHIMQTKAMNRNYKKQYNKNIKHINRAIKIAFVNHNKKVLTVDIDGSYKDELMRDIIVQYNEAGYHCRWDTNARSSNTILIALSEKYVYSQQISFKGYLDN